MKKKDLRTKSDPAAVPGSNGQRRDRSTDRRTHFSFGPIALADDLLGLPNQLGTDAGGEQVAFLGVYPGSKGRKGIHSHE